MRALFAAVLSAGLCLAYVQAPFTHVHAAGEAEEHIAEEHAGSLAFHIHLGQGRDPGASLSDPGESSRLLNWYRFEVKKPIHFSADLAPAGLVPAVAKPDTVRAVFFEQPDRLHDPPEAPPAPPRAPPSC